MPEDYRDALLRPPADRDAIRARRLATARRLLAARVAARGVVYLGQSVSAALTHLYYEAGAPYGDGLLGVLMWLDAQAAPEDTPDV
jgi:hypothetical protein